MFLISYALGDIIDDCSVPTSFTQEKIVENLLDILFSLHSLLMTGLLLFFLILDSWPKYGPSWAIHLIAWCVESLNTLWLNKLSTEKKTVNSKKIDETYFALRLPMYYYPEIDCVYKFSLSAVDDVALTQLGNGVTFVCCLNENKNYWPCVSLFLEGIIKTLRIIAVSWMLLFT